MEKLEKILGHRIFMIIKQLIKYIRDKIYLVGKERYSTFSPSSKIKVYGKKRCNVFFGYYDIQQFDSKEKKLLVHVVPKNANTRKDFATIGYYDIETEKFIKLGKSKAWCWQQGARLRWFPNNEKYILFNDKEEDSYVCKKINIITKKCEEVFCRALYDVDPFGKYGLSINYSRLQRLRPGYGYNTLADDTKGELAPKNDGIYLVDLNTNKSKLIISLYNLSETCNDPDALEHYINHISISPNGNKFMFFHIWTVKNSERWKTQLCILDKNGKNLKILEETDQVSHYDWINNNEILITGYTPERRQTYSIYNIKEEKKTVLEEKILNMDGHPTILKDKNTFITDTYPKKYDFQSLFEFNIKKNKKTEILKIYSSPLLYEEKRCDLHPRASMNEKYISIDSTFENNCRKIVLIENWKVK